MACVLTVRAERLENLYRASAFYDDGTLVAAALDTIRSHSNWVPRDQAENDPLLCQIVACAIVTRGEQVLCVKRSKRTNRSALRLRYSVMLGGHVDENDAKAPDVLDHCLRRELLEEFGLGPNMDASLLGLAVDAEHPVGLQHLGVVHRVILNEGTKVIQCDEAGEFANGGSGRTVEPVPWSFVLEHAPRLDPWSGLFIASRSFGVIVGRGRHEYGSAQWILPFSNPSGPDFTR